MWCIRPMARIVEKVRGEIPGARIIGFPRGAGTLLPTYAARVGIDAVSLDWTIDRGFARAQLAAGIAVQGNLDPAALCAGGTGLDQAVDDVLEGFTGRPFIFNLGHGVLPDTPVAHVERLIARVRGQEHVNERCHV